jgi:hypothetical protein
LRSRLGAKGDDNRKHHIKFLDAVGEDSQLHKESINWFKTLPMWIDAPDFRVTHACWDQKAIDWVKPKLNKHLCLTEDLIIAASTKSTRAHEAVETLLKGIEVRLPEGTSFKDKMGKERFSCRIKWWQSGTQTYKTAALGIDPHRLPDSPIENWKHIDRMDKPTFIGHYQLSPTNFPIAPLMPQLACVDFNAGSIGGKMAAYRYDGETTLSAENFIAV